MTHPWQSTDLPWKSPDMPWNGGQTPLTIVGSLAFWFRSDADTITAASPPLANGGDIASVSDKSGSGRDASESTNRPTWTQSGINGKGTISFVGANNDSLTIGSATGIARNVSAFWAAGVVRMADVTSANQRILSILNNGANPRFIVDCAASTSRLRLLTRRQDADTTHFASAVTTVFQANTAAFFYAHCDYVAGSVVLRVGSVEASPITPSWTAGGNTSDTNSGSGPFLGTQSTNLYTGDIAEIYGDAGTLSAAQIQQLWSYSTSYWGTA